MELDREPAVDHSQLQSLIRKHTKAETKTLTQELTKLQQKLKSIESKNTQRGPSSHPGTSSTKQVRTAASNRKSTTHTQKSSGKAKSKRNVNASADVSNKDSSRGNGRDKSRNNRTSTGKKSVRSKTGRSK
jgi:hypothetical protein